MKLDANIVKGVIEHAQQEAPIEACGYLGQRGGVACTQYRLTNVDGSAEHFSFEPAEQFEAVKRMRAQGERISAVYHSHPATPARPSKEDIRLAHDPNIIYLIVSLTEEPPELKAFWIRNGRVTPQPIEVLGENEKGAGV